MIEHLKNIEKILLYTLEVLVPQKIVNILYDKIHQLIDAQILKRDVENFSSYFKFVLSSSAIPKKLLINEEIVRVFIDRTYSGFDQTLRDQRAQRVFEYLKEKIGAGVEINIKNLSRLDRILSYESRPNFDRVKERILIALILKWFQGPLQERISDELNDYIIFLATSFGQYRSERVLNVENVTFEVSQNDLDLIISEFSNFEFALLEAIEEIRNAYSRPSKSRNGRDQFRFVFESLDRLALKSQEGKLNDVSAFKDKIIVATTLIYLQDEFVEKDVEVKNLVQLFISLYYQFRDKRHTPEILPKN
ncbi:MAG: hypothetical protein ABIL05_03975 [candidate division WOR-3 bacterium]